MALQKVGAKSVRVQTLSEPEAISADAFISLGDDDLASDLAEAFSQLGARSADPFNRRMHAVELAGALCAAVNKTGIVELKTLRRMEVKLSKYGYGVWTPNPLSIDHNMVVWDADR